MRAGEGTAKDARWPFPRKRRPPAEAIDNHGVTTTTVNSDLTRAPVAVAWRQAADEAKTAFSAWHLETTTRRRAATTAFFVALDREEQAAAEYRRAWEQWCSTVR